MRKYVGQGTRYGNKLMMVLSLEDRLGFKNFLSNISTGALSDTTTD
jgi:hypothetical protein